MERYRVTLTKKNIFVLDGKDKNGVMKQLDYIVNETKLLDMPYVKKILKIKLNKIKRKKYNKGTKKMNSHKLVSIVLNERNIK